MASDSARALLEARHLRAAIVVRDVATGVVVARASTDTSLDRGVLPLSTAKLWLAAISWEHRLPVDVNSLIVHGSDSAGRAVALSLRHTLGAKRALDDLATLGFPACGAERPLDCVSLDANTADTAWASAFSIGEANARVSLDGLSEFARLAASGGGTGGSGRRVMSVETASKLRAAMLEVVQHGTATGIKARLGALGRIGGKTGSSAVRGGELDGIFVGFAADARGRPRYAFATYVSHGGYGGGAAAEVSADVVRVVLAARSSRVQTCFLTHRLGSGERGADKSALCDRRVSPASTYKIAHALAALDAGVVAGPNDTIRYDGRATAYATARRDHTLASAIHWSVVWYFQRVAERLGDARERGYLRAFSYGNADPSSGLTTFWNGGSLAISPREQERFLDRLYENRLPVSSGAMATVREMLVEPPGTITNALGEHPFLRPWRADATLSAKTGATRTADGKAVRWIVGRISRAGRDDIFVACVLGEIDLPADAAITYAAESLRRAGIP